MPLRKRPTLPEPPEEDVLLEQERLDHAEWTGDTFDGTREEALRAAARVLGRNAGDPTQPYCTCHNLGGFTFDPQMGVYVHWTCRKPSRLYYAAALAAGIFKETV